MTRRRMAEFECPEGKREISHVLRTEAAVERYKDEFAGPAAHLLSFLSETLKDHKVRRRALSMTRWVVFFGFRPEELGTRNIASKCVDVRASSRVAARLYAFRKDSYRFSLHSSSTAEQRIDQGSGRRRYLRDRRFLLRQPDSQKSRHEKKSRGDRERELGSPQRVPEIFVDTENHLRRDDCRKHLKATVERTGIFSVLLRLKAL